MERNRERELDPRQEKRHDVHRGPFYADGRKFAAARLREPSGRTCTQSILLRRRKDAAGPLRVSPAVQ